MGGKRQIALLLVISSLLLTIPSLIFPADNQNQAASQQDVYKKMVLYVLEDSSGHYQLGMMSLKGDDKKIITKNGNNWCPAVSDSGDRIAFYSDRSGSTNLWIMNTDGTKQEQITFDKEGISRIDLYNRGQIQWSKDSQNVYFIKNGDIWNMDKTGETPLALTNYHDITTFKLSPDKEKIVFAREKTIRHNGLWKMNINGTSAKQITPSDIITPSFDWASDSLGLVYSTNRVISQIEYSGVNNKVYKVTNMPENDVEWSRSVPDRNSNMVAYVSATDDIANIFISRPDGTQETQLTKKGGYSPYWSPDGKEIVYIEGSDLFIQNIAEKDKLRLTYSFSVYYPVVAEFKISTAAAK